uniref:Uncharacterized protein n=1 Tax=Salmo trutta TaxID=8032 RepID=A0A674B9Z6_SALTR
VPKHSTNLRVRMPVLEVLFLALYAAFVSCDDDAKLQNNETKPLDNALYRYYPFFADIQVMILKSVLGAFWPSFACTASVGRGPSYFQFSHDGTIHLGVINLINAEFAVVLISVGVALGKTSLVQLLVKALLEISVFSVNEWGCAQVPEDQRCRGIHPHPPVSLLFRPGYNVCPVKATSE